jgi:PAS domain S-box-containing protein
MKENLQESGNIYVIDDNDYQVLYIREILTKVGYHVGSASSGEAAFADPNINTFNLILLDIGLPGMDGFDVCKELKSRPDTKDIPVIFISAFGDNDNVYQKGFELGVMDYLKKPVTFLEIIFKVRLYLRRATLDAKMKRDDQLLRSIIDDQVEFFVRYKRDGTLIFANPSFCNYFGKDISEILSCNFYKLLEISRVEDFLPADLTTDCHSNPKTIQLKNPDGETAWHQWTQRLIKDNDTSEAIIQSIGNDITSVKLNESKLSRYEYIFNHAGGGIVVSTKLLYFSLINEAYAEMHGYTVDELVNKKISTVFRGESDSFVLDVMRKAMRNGHYAFQSIHKRKDGTEFPAFSDIKIFRNHDGDDPMLIVSVQDISESVANTGKLAESEERFRTIFRTAPDIMVIFRLKDSVLVDVNDQFTKGTKLSKESIIDRHYKVSDFFKNPADFDKIDKLLQTNEELSNLEVKLKPSSEISYTTLVSTSRIIINGEDHVIATIRNIEDIKKIQDSLQRSETKFRLLANYTYNWEFWLGPDGKFIYISPSCEKVSGYKPIDFEMDSGLMLQLIHKDYFDLCGDHFLNGHKDTDLEINLEFPIIDRFGEKKWISHNCHAVFNEQGVFLGRRGNNRDITQKKKSENELHKLLIAIEQSSSGVVITDTQGKIEYVNPYFEHLTGYTNAEVIGKKPNILKSGKTDPKIYDEVWESITSGKIWQGEFINKKKNGDLYIEHAIITPVRDDNSEIVNYIAIKQDITKQKEMDRKILQTIMATEEKERARLSQDLHDDLGPLLSTAKLYIKSLETPKNAQSKQIAIDKSIEAINASIMSIKEIANNLSPYILRNFGLIPGISSLIKKIHETVDITILFVTDIEERFNDNIESSVFRVVTELINNTIKHASASRVELSIEKGRNELVITYSDNGCGLVLENALNKNMSNGLTNIINRVKSHAGEITFGIKSSGFSVFMVIPIKSMVIV